MNKFLIVVMLLAAQMARCQVAVKVDSVNYYISKLDWKSFVIGSTYVPQIGLKEDAKRLVAIKDKDKIKKLINNIGTDQKTAAIHIILSRLLDPKRQEIRESYKYNNDGSVKGIFYSYNRLTWAADSLFNYSITQAEIDKINQYWKKRCHL